jgi:5-methylcytosine-specific restriction endonuclease McrA
MPAMRTGKKRRNDAPWREECLARRGRFCRACGPAGVGIRKLEIDHVKPRSQGGPSIVENGLVLCAAHHAMKTESRILIRREWLDPDQIDWLAAVGWVCWDADGQVSGRGMRHFAATDAA